MKFKQHSFVDKKKLCAILVFCIGSFFVQAQNKKGKTERPNIIVFLIDDMGWQDTSVPFWTSVTELNKRYHTPNMEKMAKEGMKFTNAYATPVCTPTRVSMLTGMNAVHHGVTSWTSPWKNNNTDNKDSELELVNWKINGLSPVPHIDSTVYATPFPKLLKDSGYFTVHVGKAHWGSMGTPGANPYNMGFAVNIAGHAAGHPRSYLGQENFGNTKDKQGPHAVIDLEEYHGEDIFLTEALTLEAIKSLEAPIHNKQPFYLNMAHYAVHDPLTADDRFYQKYFDQGLDVAEAKYASMIEGMDKSLGDIMNFLKKEGVEKNTVIIFMSDNGGLSQVPPRGGVVNTHNLPLKAGKGSVYEGGIREPMIVKWPSVVKPSTVTNQYVIIDDFFPTIMEMAQIKNYKTIQEIDGKSFLPILKNPNYTDTTRTLFWHSPHKWMVDGPGINFHSAARKGDWKLVYSFKKEKNELFNLRSDIGENHDVSEQHPEKVKELAKLLSDYLRKCNVVMPVKKSTGQHVPMPDEVK